MSELSECLVLLETSLSVFSGPYPWLLVTLAAIASDKGCYSWTCMGHLVFKRLHCALSFKLCVVCFSIIGLVEMDALSLSKRGPANKTPVTKMHIFQIHGTIDNDGTGDSCIVIRSSLHGLGRLCS